MDELAAKLGMDPLEFRMKNDPSEVRREEFRIGAEKIGWATRDARRQDFRPAILRGVGMGAAVWYNTGGTGPRATVTVHRDGSAEVVQGVQDLGTGARTMVGIVAAEELGLPLESLGPDRGHASALRARLGRLDDHPLERACHPGGRLSRDAPHRRSRGEGVEGPRRRGLAEGVVSVRGTEARSSRWNEACAKLLPGEGVSASAERAENHADAWKRFTSGAQFAEVEVDTETGLVRVENRRRPRLRPRRQRADRREPGPGRRHPGDLLRALREPGPRPPDRPHGQSQRRPVQDRGRARRAGHRGRLPPGLGRRQQHAFGGDRRAGHGADGRGHRQRRLARHRGADPQLPITPEVVLAPWTRPRSEGGSRMKPFTLVRAGDPFRGRPRRRKPGAEVKAGGVDLLDRMKEGFDSPTARRLDRATCRASTRSRPGRPAKIGALATLARIAADAGLRKRYPALADAGGRSRHAADPQHGDARRQPLPAAALLVLPPGGIRLPQEGRQRPASRRTARTGSTRSSTRTSSAAASIRRRRASPCWPTARASTSCRRRGGGRLPMDHFFFRPTDDAPRENVLAPGEIIETVTIPAPAAGARSVYSKLKEKESFDWPLVEACVSLTISGGAVREARASSSARWLPRRTARRSRGDPARRDAEPRARRARRGGRRRTRQTARAERLQGPTREGPARARPARGLRLTDDPLARCGASPRARRPIEPDPLLCRHLRTKTWYAPDAFGEGDPRQSPSTAQYWCLRTMRRAGPTATCGARGLHGRARLLRSAVGGGGDA